MFGKQKIMLYICIVELWRNGRRRTNLVDTVRSVLYDVHAGSSPANSTLILKKWKQKSIKQRKDFLNLT